MSQAEVEAVEAMSSVQLQISSSPLQRLRLVTCTCTLQCQCQVRVKGRRSLPAAFSVFCSRGSAWFPVHVDVLKLPVSSFLR